METEQDATKKTNGSMRKSRRKLKSNLRQIIMKTHPLRIYGMHQKQFSGKFIEKQAFLKKEEKSQIDNVIHT